jgi:hypothetical protein
MSPSFARGVTANGNRTWRLYREMGQQLRSPQPAFALRLSVQTLIVLDGSGTSWSSDITAEAFGTRMRAFRILENISALAVPGLSVNRARSIRAFTVS